MRDTIYISDKRVTASTPTESSPPMRCVHLVVSSRRPSGGSSATHGEIDPPTAKERAEVFSHEAAAWFSQQINTDGPRIRNGKSGG